MRSIQWKKSIFSLFALGLAGMGVILGYQPAIAADASLVAPVTIDSPYILDHFKCYPVASPVAPLTIPIHLIDQFDKSANAVDRVNREVAEHLCNPVAKLHLGRITPIQHPYEHLKIYRFGRADTTKPSLAVSVANQFGKQTLKVLQAAEGIAVPTHTSDWAHPLPYPLRPFTTDHFKCYRASGDAINTPVTLRDQFGIERVQVSEVFGFCNPVEKRHFYPNGTVAVFKIKHPLAHLTCYTTKSLTTTPQIPPVRTFNQFGQEGQKLAQADILCVPSAKIAWTGTVVTAGP